MSWNPRMAWLGYIVLQCLDFRLIPHVMTWLPTPAVRQAGLPRIPVELTSLCLLTPRWCKGLGVNHLERGSQASFDS